MGFPAETLVGCHCLLLLELGPWQRQSAAPRAGGQGRQTHTRQHAVAPFPQTGRLSLRRQCLLEAEEERALSGVKVCAATAPSCLTSTLTSCSNVMLMREVAALRPQRPQRPRLQRGEASGSSPGPGVRAAAGPGNSRFRRPPSPP